MTSAPVRTERLRLTLHGAVQGVGFRPLVYRLAGRLRLAGWVRNTPAGLQVEVEGSPEQIDTFVKQMEEERPAAALITEKEVVRLAPQGGMLFEILPSDDLDDTPSARTTSLLPDLATCPQCLAELFDPDNRRFGYPFTNCTLCGPRYSMQLDIPYDRPNTTMKDFTLCAACRREYESFADRRFHAQPNACGICGPQVELLPSTFQRVDPFRHAAESLAHGKIVALKGIGGFQLLVDARNPEAVCRLRERKHREDKPFALLMPSLECLRTYCETNTAVEELLLSQAAPIVLVSPLAEHDLAPQVCMGSPRLGVMLPSSPMHHLLVAQYPFPVVATSGNLEGEPIAIENNDAVARLQGIADVFLLHNRPIARPCDDSVTAVLQGKAVQGTQMLRRARGYAPLPILTPCDLRPVLAVGGHMKNTVAVALGRQIFLSQHIGDLHSMEARNAFERAIADLCKLYRFQPEAIACDLHPDYASTAWARERACDLGVPLLPIQHHHAHVAACAAENGLTTDYLGVAWDGTGLGTDGSIWGGEFFVASVGGFERIAHLRPFALPGMETAMHDCSRPAAGVLWESIGEEEFRTRIDPRILALLQQDLYAPKSSSVGRLFDAVASLTGVATHNHYEGQAAMMLEAAMGRNPAEGAYEISFRNGIGDWSGMIREILRDIKAKTDVALISARFHHALANWIVGVAQDTGMNDVVLSGGVFQNSYLMTRAASLLDAAGFHVHMHHQVPPNDGGLSLGQAFLAGRS